MDSALLTGIAREPVTALTGQIEGWDNADVLMRLASAIKHGGARVLPDEIKTRLAELSESVPWPSSGSAADSPRFEEALDLRLMKLSRLCDYLGIRMAAPPTRPSLNEACLRIEDAMVGALRRVDERSMSERLRWKPRRGFDGRSVLEATQYVVTKLFEQLARDFADMPEQERRRIAQEIADAIDRLDPETQVLVRERLDIDRIGADALMRTGAIASLGTSVGAAVAIGGFGSYTLLTSTIASIASVFGLTLPFKFYILATSSLAFLSNPLTLAGLALGGGYFLRAKANKSIRERYLTVLVALSVVAGNNRSASVDPVEELVSHARTRYRQFLLADGGQQQAYWAAFPSFRM